MVHDARGEQAAQHAVRHLMHAGGRQLAGRQRRAQRLVEEHLAVDLLAGLLVQTGLGCAERMHGAPVGHHPAAIAPVVAQHAGQQFGVLAGVGPVHPVVGTHHRAGLALLDGDLEGEQIGLPRRRLVHRHVQDLAAGLLVVQGEMLGGGDDMGALDAADRGARQGSGQQRVFAEVFEIAAVARFAGQVRAAGQHDVEALLPRLFADHRAARLDDRGVEGGGQGQARG